MLVLWTIFSIVVGCLILGALQVLLSAFKKDMRDPRGRRRP